MTIATAQDTSVLAWNEVCAIGLPYSATAKHLEQEYEILSDTLNLDSPVTIYSLYVNGRKIGTYYVTAEAAKIQAEKLAQSSDIGRCLYSVKMRQGDILFKLEFGDAINILDAEQRARDYAERHGYSRLGWHWNITYTDL